MAKKAEATEVNARRVAAVASALDGVMSAAATVGRDLVTQCVKVCKAQFRNADVTDAEADAIAEALREKRGWTDASFPQRKSETKALLRAYRELEELARLFLQKTGGCTWHNVVMLARELPKHKGKNRVTQCVNALINRKGNSKKPNALTRKEAKASAASAVKRILKMTHIEKSFRDALEELCEEYNIAV